MRVGGQPFHDTILALNRDQQRSRTHWLIGVSTVISGMWIFWACRSTLDLVVVSQQARLEEVTYYPITPIVSGRVVRTRIDLNRHVKVGELLIEVDQDVKLSGLVEAEERLENLVARIKALNITTLADDHRSQRGNTRPGQSPYDSPKPKKNARIDYNGMELGHAKELALILIHQELNHLRAQKRDLEANVDLAYRRFERKAIVASHDGKLAENVPVQVGSYVRQGDPLGIILPGGPLQVVSYFRPEDASGRLRPGQRGVFRLAASSWREFGTIPIAVSRVASAPKQRLIRVEMELDPSVGSRLPLEHGLDGQVEVIVDRITPIRLFAKLSGEELASKKPKS